MRTLALSLFSRRVGVSLGNVQYCVFLAVGERGNVYTLASERMK